MSPAVAIGVPAVALVAGGVWWARSRGISLPFLSQPSSDAAPPTIPDRVPDLSAMLAGKSGPQQLDRKAKKELGACPTRSAFLTCSACPACPASPPHPPTLWVQPTVSRLS